MKLSENGDMENHINTMLNLADQLAALGEVLKDKMVIALILCSLPESYNTLITALETRSEDELTIELVKGKLLDEDRRRKNAREHIDEQDDKALKTQFKKFVKPTSPKLDVKDITCFFCKKPGHLKKDCRKYIRWKAAKEKPKANQAVNDDKDTQICFSARKGSDSKGTWYIDSGATSHMSNNESFFDTFNIRKNEVITLANGDSADVQGIGDGRLTCKDNKGKQNTFLVKDVLYVPTLEESLLSVKKLTEKGLEVRFMEDVCHITKGKVTVATADMNGNLYKLRSDKALTVGNRHRKDCQHTWHKKLGHRDPEAIRQMERKNLAAGLRIMDCGIRGVCETCIKGKMTRLPFPKKSFSKTEEPLNLVHTDVCGPMQTKTPGNKRYVLTLIDDYSKHTDIYLMEYKSEVTEKIQDYVKNMKIKFKKVPKIIRSDRGREYVNANLKSFLRKEGIEVQYTVGYAPEQNGTAERKNRYLMEMARCMLIDAGLPNKYWGEAVCTANYLQNRIYTKVTGTTPYERWYKKKPSLQHIHTFGSKAYAHIPKEFRRKLDEKAKMFVFVGYAEDSKGYRLLDTNTDKVIISRDVIFSQEEDESREVIIEIQKKQEIQHDKNGTNDHEAEGKDNESREQQEEMASIQHEKDRESQPRRSQRHNKGIPPNRYSAYCIQEAEMLEPNTYEEAAASSRGAEWIKSMSEEYDTLIKARTWMLVVKPGTKTL